MTLSVIVFAYRNDDTILRAVGSIAGQEADEPVEIVVITSGPGEAGRLVESRFPDVRVECSAPRLTPGAARNRGVAAATGDLVAFLEGDCAAEPGWVGGRLAAHRAGRHVVACAMTPLGAAGLCARASHYLTFPARVPHGPGVVVDPLDTRAHGLSFDRSVLDRVGPFPEDCVAGEDTAVAKRVGEAGIEIWFEPAVRTAHPTPVGLRALWRDARARGAKRAASAPGPAPGPARRAFAFGWRLQYSWRAAHRHEPAGSQVALLPALAAGTAAYVIGWSRGASADG